MIIIGIRNRVLICMLISCKVSQSFVLSSQKGEDDDLYHEVVLDIHRHVLLCLI